MVIEISSGLIIGAAIAYIGPAIGFIIWVKIEVSLLKQNLNNIAHEKQLELNDKHKENEKLETLISDLSKKVDEFAKTTNQNLYDLNGKVTEALTLAKVNNK